MHEKQKNSRNKFMNFSFSSTAIIIFIGIILINIPASEAICDEFDWECDNGDCIDIQGLCDGSFNCTDHSDEIAYNCAHQNCPTYSFRCAYGACIQKQKKCNGVKDCADGSDESMRLCGQEEKLDRTIQGSCGDYMMECSPGKCLDISRLCDGRYDCDNHLDESIEFCAFNLCPKYSFQCAYGACIAPVAKCNSSSECHDRSDEAHELCGFKRISTASLSAVTETKFLDSSIDDNEEVLANSNPNICLLPPNRPHLLIKGKGKIITGPIPKNTFVHYSCVDGYSLAGKTEGFCFGPNMNENFPKCEKFCKRSEILGDFTLNVLQCNYGVDSFPCEENPKIRPGTLVSIKCAAYYNPPQERSRRCTQEGRWTSFTNDCTMYCGTTLNPFARGGIDVAKGDIPWHIGIYSILNKVTYNYTCGGTILSPLVVVSAAHCVYDIVQSTSRPPEYFQVVAGKFYRNYYKWESNAQPRNVSSILLHRNYKHSDLLQNDVAILILTEPLLFTASIRPICLGSIDHFENPTGRLSAWGLSSNPNEKFEVLQVVGGEHLNRDICLKETDEAFAGDKFCMKYLDYAVACRGDSGGGYFVKHNKQHYLIGVLSTAGDIDEAGCSISNSLLFLTNTSNHISWIKETIREAERKYKIEQTNLVANSIE